MFQVDSIFDKKKKKKKNKSKNSHKNQKKFVSGANYFAETLEWFGYFIACSNFASFTYLVATIANIVPRAVSHHEWYLKTFKGKYPKNRKAVIPFIW